MKNKIGILTGGGDVPGLNPVIKSVVYRARAMGREVVGIRKGWQGLTHMDRAHHLDPAYTRTLTRENTRTIDRTGGTVLHTSRTNPERIRPRDVPPHLPAAEVSKLATDGEWIDFTPVVLRNIEHLGLGSLVVIGGDDTLGYGLRLHREGVPIVAIPKTMDNDVRGTEYCIGFSTAITRAKDIITRARTTLGSHERIGIFRIFGRDAGFTALYTGYVTSNRCLIPEHAFDIEKVCQMLVEDRRANPSSYSLIIVSEGAVWEGIEVAEIGEEDAYGHRRKVDIGHALAEEVKRRTGIGTMLNHLTYDLRSGEPDAVDQLVATTFANIALDLIADGETGGMVAVKNGCYARVALPDPKLGPRQVDVDRLYDTDRYRPRYTAKLGAPLLLSPP